MIQPRIPFTKSAPFIHLVEVVKETDHNLTGTNNAPIRKRSERRIAGTKLPSNAHRPLNLVKLSVKRVLQYKDYICQKFLRAKFKN